MTNRQSERGIALVLSLFLMMAMSVIAASLMFMSQTETYASMNYRLMSQARYGAEAGIQKAANFLLYSYAPPTTAGVDPLAAYTYAGVAPVRWNNQPVVLSMNPGVASNYPVQAVVTAFQNAMQGPFIVNGTTVNYQPYATLMSMEQVTVYGGGLQTVQTWQITSDGVVNVGRTAKVEVTAIVETQAVPANMYAAFATNVGCGAMQFQGSSSTDSYDSTANWGGGAPTTGNGGLSLAMGNVGTNGNLGESGHATINGTLSSPRVGVGACSAGNVDALSQAGSATVTGGVLQLPQAVAMPAPTAPNPVPPTTALSLDQSSTCAMLAAAGVYSAPATCNAVAGAGNNPTVISLNPNGTTIVMGNLSLGSKIELDLAPGTYNVNSLSMGSQSTLGIQDAAGPVVMNVAGNGVTPPTPVVDMSAGAWTTSGYDASRFQIDYSGTGNVKFDGHAGSAAMFYAPNAAVTFVGTADFYGSVVASTFVDNGNASIHYDRHLNSMFYVVGNTMLSSFSWKRF